MKQSERVMDTRDEQGSSDFELNSGQFRENLPEI